MRRAFHLLRRAAQVRSPVLLRGEVGRGKHEAARSIHARGATASGEFVLFDCSAVPGPQVEQELFGDDGAFAAARGGTLFLHEVGDLPVKAQARLAVLLERTGWTVVAAARAAGVEREYIYRLIKRHGLQRPR